MSFTPDEVEKANAAADTILDILETLPPATALSAVSIALASEVIRTTKKGGRLIILNKLMGSISRGLVEDGEA